MLSRKVANSYSVGNVFLAGDAAHAFPPTGGLGLNTGLADVHNLAYKIAAVHQGWGESSLLESYHSERRPIAMINAAQSVKNGKAIFSFLKTLGTAGIEDVDQARANLLKSIHDPEKQEMIEREVEGQREHFDNVSDDILRGGTKRLMILSSWNCISGMYTARRKCRHMLPITRTNTSPVPDCHTPGSALKRRRLQAYFDPSTCHTSRSGLRKMYLPVRRQPWTCVPMTLSL